MTVRSAKRIYSLKALESWFSRLLEPWEQHFTEEELALARKIYTSGEVRELELGADDAMVRFQIDGSDAYSLIEWSGKGMDIRGSVPDRELARALGAAGLYEIEELVTEEVSSAIPDANEAEEESPAAVEAPPPVGQDDSLPRRLVLKFDACESGLLFQPYWRDVRGQEESAVGKGSSVASAGEREILIRLTSMAHKSGFRFDGAKGQYILESFNLILPFLRDGIEEWSKRFDVECGRDVERMKLGVQEVTVTAVASSDEQGTLQMDWDFQVGDSVLGERERERLLKKGSAPVFLPGRGVVRLHDRESEALRDWQQRLSDCGANGVPRYMIFSLFDRFSGGLELSPELAKWRDELEQQSEDDLPVPPMLRHYQQVGVRWLARVFNAGCNCLLADEMGLGKTLQVLALLKTRPVAGRPNLIVCPASVIPVWQQEAERFFPEFRVAVLQAGNTFANTTGIDLWLASYTQIRRQRALLDDVEFGYAVLDEGQFIKNPDAKVSHACMAIRAKHRMVLSGTPLENHQLDLWSLFRFLMPGLLGNRAAFAAACTDVSPEFMRRLRRQIQPFVLRRTKKEVVRELPEKVEMNLLCPMTDVQRREYVRLTTEGVERWSGTLESAFQQAPMGVLTLLTRLRQVCCDPGLLPWMHSGPGQSGKLTVLLERVNELVAGGHKVVVFSQFVRLLQRARQVVEGALPDLPLYELFGHTNDRARPVDEFQTIPGPALFFVSLRAGGTGITLNAADYVFLLDPWWNPAVEDQAIDRVHRIGQQKPVFVYRMIAPNTVEDRIQQLKSRKHDLFDRTVSHLDALADIRSHFHSLRALVGDAE